MKRFLFRWLTRFFERDRGRFLTIVGISVITPIKISYCRDAVRYRRISDSYDIYCGRVDLLINMLRDRL